MLRTDIVEAVQAPYGRSNDYMWYVESQSGQLFIWGITLCETHAYPSYALCRSLAKVHKERRGW